MINSKEELCKFLQGTPLAGNKIASVSVGKSQAKMFVIEVKADLEKAWTHMHACMEKTGRYPVLTTFWGSIDLSCEEDVQSEFSRSSFEDEWKKNRKGDEAEDIIQAAEALDVLSVLSNQPEDDSVTLEEWVEICEDNTESHFGKVPKIADPLDFIEKNNLHTQKAIEQWFFQWELEHCDDPLSLPEGGLSHMDWFDPDDNNNAIVLIPSLNSWEVPAYINWYGSGLYSSEIVVALLRYWKNRYGAELVANYGTMLHLIANNPPKTPEDAFELAWQQQIIAPCTTILPGVSPRDHARALLQTSKWFLHERP